MLRQPDSELRPGRKGTQIQLFTDRGEPWAATAGAPTSAQHQDFHGQQEQWVAKWQKAQRHEGGGGAQSKRIQSRQNKK